MGQCNLPVIIETLFVYGSHTQPRGTDTINC